MGSVFLFSTASLFLLTHTLFPRILHMPSTPTPPTHGLRRPQVEKAATALLAHAKAERARGGGQLFDEEDQFVYMVREEGGE